MCIICALDRQLLVSDGQPILMWAYSSGSHNLPLLVILWHHTVKGCYAQWKCWHTCLEDLCKLQQLSQLCWQWADFMGQRGGSVAGSGVGKGYFKCRGVDLGGTNARWILSPFSWKKVPPASSDLCQQKSWHRSIQRDPLMDRQPGKIKLSFLLDYLVTSIACSTCSSSSSCISWGLGLGQKLGCFHCHWQCW